MCVNRERKQQLDLRRPSDYNTAKKGVRKMAKVTGPLHSDTASGQLGRTIVFNKNGTVRKYLVPANPMTSLQGETRQVMLNVAKAIALLDVSFIESVRAIVPLAYRWSAFLIQSAVGQGLTAWNNAIAQFAALTNAEQTAWNDEATARGITQYTVSYATTPAPTSGATMFALANAAYTLGVAGSLAAPNGTNAISYAQLLFGVNVP